LTFEVIELKKPGVSARAAFDENLTSYKQTQNGNPALFVFNALLIASADICHYPDSNHWECTTSITIFRITPTACFDGEGFADESIRLWQTKVFASDQDLECGELLPRRTVSPTGRQSQGVFSGPVLAPSVRSLVTTRTSTTPTGCCVEAMVR